MPAVELSAKAIAREIVQDQLRRRHSCKDPDTNVTASLPTQDDSGLNTPTTFACSIFIQAHRNHAVKMRTHLSAKLLLLLAFSERVISAPRDGAQVVIAPFSSGNDHEPGSNGYKQHDDLVANTQANQATTDHVVDDSILNALSAHSDPVDALLSLQPELAAQMAEPRLIRVHGQAKAVWMTEGDKLRLRREMKKFMDITDHQELYAQSESVSTWAGKASKRYQLVVHSPAFPQTGTD